MIIPVPGSRDSNPNPPAETGRFDRPQAHQSQSSQSFQSILGVLVGNLVDPGNGAHDGFWCTVDAAFVI